VIALELSGAVEALPASVGVVFIKVIAVDQLMQDEMPLRVIPQIGGADELVEVGAVIVEIAAHPDFTLVGEVDHLLLAKRAELVLLGGGAKSFNNVFWVKRHRGKAFEKTSESPRKAAILTHKGSLVNGRADAGIGVPAEGTAAPRAACYPSRR
jgi:hypothetical protein